MDNATYEAAWDAVEPIMDKYLFEDLTAMHKRNPKPTQEDYNQLHADYIVARDAAMVPFGISFNELSDENGRRFDYKVLLRGGFGASEEENTRRVCEQIDSKKDLQIVENNPPKTDLVHVL